MLSRDSVSLRSEFPHAISSLLRRETRRSAKGNFKIRCALGTQLIEVFRNTELFPRPLQWQAELSPRVQSFGECRAVFRIRSNDDLK